MKKIFVSMLALALTTGVMAQTVDKSTETSKKEWRKKGGEDRKGKMDKLNLSEDQKAQMKTLNQDFKNQMQNLNQDKALSEDAKKQKRMGMMKDHRTKIEGMLNADQKKIWQENSGRKMDGAKMKGDKMKGGKGMARNGKMAGGEKRMEKMQKDLNLTTDQSAKFKSLNQDFKTNAEKIRNNSSLSQEQKKEQMKDLHKNHKQAMESMLTREQKEKMKDLHKNRKGHGEQKVTK